MWVSAYASRIQRVAKKAWGKVCMAQSKVVVVTGAAKRAGEEIAYYFAQQGYDVAVHYNQSESDAERVVKAIEKMGRRACQFKADLTQADQIECLFKAIYTHFQRVDVLVNCAAIFLQDHFSNFSVEQFDVAWQTNCRAPILLTQAFYQQAIAHQHSGVVINVVDQKIKNNFHRDHFSYTVGKTALGNLTKMLALSASPTLRVNAVYPGLLLPSDDQTQADFDYARAHATPLGYTATPLELAQAAYHLTQPCYNGSDLLIDAGQNLVGVERDVIYAHRAP